LTGLDARGGHEPGGGAAVLLQVQEREGDDIGLEAVSGGATGRVHPGRAGGGGGELPQEVPAPGAEDLLAGLGDDGEDAADAPGLDADRAVRPGEIALLEEPMAVEREQAVDGDGGLAGGAHVGEHRAEDLLDLGPHVERRLTEGRGMLGAEERGVGVVVEERVLVAPPDREREARGEDDAHRGAQRLRP
jgi:hypothetical protein